LTTIGHPRIQGAIDATAMDLITWCKGAIIQGRIVTAEQQAEGLVNEARTGWDEWPEKGGTRQLLNLFRSRYSPSGSQQQVVADPSYADFVKRGILAPPCSLCVPGAIFCEYGSERAHTIEAEVSARFAQRPAKSGIIAPGVDLSYEAIQQHASAVYADEQRRKHAQLERERDA
jgi:hypothetical protein